MITKIIQISSEFYDRFIKVYFETYFSWLTEKLSGTEPFSMLLISVGLFFILAFYIWFRNRDV